jgi:branched-chain amino acid transport system ATP-binding protein
MNLLEIKDLKMQFGGLVAVDDFNLSLEEGKIFGLIGPNGSGKTTVFNMITGFYNPTSGHIFLDGKEITGLSPDRIAALGLTRIFQNTRIFRNLTVFDNTMIGDHLRLKSTPFEAILKTPRYIKEEREAYQRAMDLLEGLGLIEYVNEISGSLPYGLQRKLEVARALSTQPKVLLLDEPATGMSTEETGEMINFILGVRKNFDLTIFIIEHHMQVIMDICEQILVLDYGKTIAMGNPKEIQNNQEVIEAYLGVS